MKNVQPVIEIKCYGRTTEVIVAGIDISSCLKSIDYSAKAPCEKKPVIGLEIEVSELLHIIDSSNIDVNKAMGILQPYLCETNMRNECKEKATLNEESSF